MKKLLLIILVLGLATTATNAQTSKVKKENTTQTDEWTGYEACDGCTDEWAGYEATNSQPNYNNNSSNNNNRDKDNSYLKSKTKREVSDTKRRMVDLVFVTLTSALLTIVP